jgi:hypothetical protein
MQPPARQVATIDLLSTTKTPETIQVLTCSCSRSKPCKAVAKAQALQGLQHVPPNHRDLRRGVWRIIHGTELETAHIC